MTRAEEILWMRLRGSRFHGAKFKRQVPFDRYVADFYCHASKLVVEVDGKQHKWFAVDEPCPPAEREQPRRSPETRKWVPRRLLVVAHAAAEVSDPRPCGRI
jgi:hypothetical protein